jgi:amidase
VTDLFRFSAHELAELTKTKSVSCREVVENHLERIAAVNGEVNAITVVLDESGLERADQLDKSSATDQPFFGVPFTVKENIDCVGSATTNGLKQLEHSMPTLDAPIVSRMIAAGGIPIGRTNMPDMGMRLTTDSSLRGRTLNPWNSQLTAGGSSGGEGVALATGMSPFGLGNDIGGSVRNPAYCCGVAALKPTAGRVPRAGSIEPLDFGMASQLMLTEGLLSRSVKDLEQGLSVVAGRHIRDPRSVEAPLRGVLPEVPSAALVTEIPNADIPAATLQQIRRAGKILEEAGWRVDEAVPPELAKVSEIWGSLISIDFSVLLPNIQAILAKPVYDNLKELCTIFDCTNTPNSVIHAERSRLIRMWSEFFQSYSVAIGPTWTQLPWPFDADLEPKAGTQLVLDTNKFITPGSALGIPAVAIPMGVADGMPAGIQIYSDLWREDLCLSAGTAIEDRIESITPINPVID